MCVCARLSTVITRLSECCCDWEEESAKVISSALCVLIE